MNTDTVEELYSKLPLDCEVMYYDTVSVEWYTPTGETWRGENDFEGNIIVMDHEGETVGVYHVDDVIKNYTE